MRKCIIIMVLVCFSVGVSKAQVFGSHLKTREIEFGTLTKWYNRDFSHAKDWNWSIWVFFLKYGIHERISLAIEGNISNRPDDRSSESDIRGYFLGSGITFHISTYKIFKISLGLQYSEALWFDRARMKLHQNHRSYLSAIQIETPVSIFGEELSLHFGPAYIYDEIYQYAWGFYTADAKRSINNFGFFFGCSKVLASHFEPFFQIVYANHLQPRLGIGYRF